MSERFWCEGKCVFMSGTDYRDIVLIGNAGEYGSLQLAAEYPEEMKKRFPEFMLVGLFTSVRNDRELLDYDIVGESDVIVEVGSRGVSAALWELGEKVKSGFKVYADKIPVSQLTVEICELFGKDPYKCESKGCYMVCTKNGNELCEMLANEGKQAVVIGHTVESKGRVMIMGEVTRYIEKPRQVTTK